MLQKYKFLLFDADDTLLDFKAAELEALSKLFHSLSLELTPTIHQRYHEINISLWKAFEKNEITRDQIISTRFRLLFHELKIDNIPNTIETDYLDYLAQGHQTIHGAKELLTTLKSSHQLYIVSNGIASTQHRRLKESGLYEYFNDIFISEDTGYQKPQKGFFEYVQAHIPNFQKDKALIIGDSLSSDIQGGFNFGIDTCWYHPNAQENPKNLPINYEITSLSDLLTL